MIDPERITSVLLIDGWHNVERGTFTIGLYEFGTERVGAIASRPVLEVSLSSQQARLAGVCPQGYTFLSGVREYGGPMTAILAVRWEQ